MEKSDIELMMELKEGNASAFDIIYKRYQKGLIAFAFQEIGNNATAEDLVAETFVRIWKERYFYEPEGKFSAFIFTILRNIIIDYVRKHKEIIIDPEIEVPDKELSGMENVEIEEVREKVLGRLNENERELYRLKFIEGKSYEEISKILGVSIPDLRERWHRLLNKLKELLEPYL